MRMRMIAMAAVCLIMSGQAASAVGPAMHLDSLQIKLVYKGTGAFSQDISVGSFNAWNTVIGEGDSAEPADDMIAYVVVGSMGQQSFRETPISVMATDARGKILARRRFDNVLTTDAGKAFLPVFIPDSTCSGMVTVTATMGTERMVKSVAMACGE